MEDPSTVHRNEHSCEDDEHSAETTTATAAIIANRNASMVPYNPSQQSSKEHWTGEALTQQQQRSRRSL